MKISIVCFLLIIHLCQSELKIRKQWDGGFQAAILAARYSGDVGMYDYLYSFFNKKLIND